MQRMRRHFAGMHLVAVMIFVVLFEGGCSTVSDVEDQAAFMADAATATRWFEQNVPGLREQIDRSAGYVVFPSVTQWGTLIGGEQFGRHAKQAR